MVDENPGRQNKIDQKRIEQVDTILRAATAVFAELGYAGARVDEIARRAGVNKATIYYRIGDKRELYARALHTVISDLGERLSQSLNKEKDPIENIKTYLSMKYLIILMLLDTIPGMDDPKDSILQLFEGYYPWDHPYLG